MCRLLGYASRTPHTFSNVVGKDFDAFVALANEHCDGWGIAASNTGQTKVALYKEPIAATKSTHFAQEIDKNEADGALLHLRWATPGMTLEANNTHPFTHNGISFIHNGAISDYEALDTQIDPKYLAAITGTTDSERYFYFLLTQIDKFGLVQGTQSAIDYIKTNLSFSSINLMLMSEDTFLTACVFNPDKIPESFRAQGNYYDLRYTKTPDRVLVGSSGWDQEGWEEIPNNTLLVVNRKTMESELVPVT